MFSGGVYFLARSSLFQQLDRQLAHDISAIRAVLGEGVVELAEIEEHGSMQLFHVAEGQRLIYQTRLWNITGLGAALESANGDASRSWKPVTGRSYRLKISTVPVPKGSRLIAVAREEGTIRQSLKRLKTTLFIVFPFAIILAVVVGHFLAGRVLSPIGAMASKAEQITAQRLSERLPVQDPDNELGRLAVVFNRTLAGLEESFGRLRRFTADASHELRTPLTAIRSVGEVGLSKSLEPAAYREVIGSMLEEADRLASLVNALLILTRADSGKARLDRQPLDLSLLAEDVCDYLRVLADEKKQDMRLEVQERLVVAGDRATLRQALVNLVDNAIKYTPAGGRIRIVVRPSSKGRAAIEVIDEGPGIDTCDQERIFDRFYRVDRGDGSKTGGIGLGLSIARWAVQANEGSIELESEEGGGSIFRILLPC
ncbi:MAG: sensor histidine kinase [Acidobacteriota bacterium]